MSQDFGSIGLPSGTHREWPVSIWGCASKSRPEADGVGCSPGFLAAALCCPACALGANATLIANEPATSCTGLGEQGTMLAAVMCLFQSFCMCPALGWATHQQRQQVAQTHHIGLGCSAGACDLAEACCLMPCALHQTHQFLADESRRLSSAQPADQPGSQKYDSDASLSQPMAQTMNGEASSWQLAHSIGTTNGSQAARQLTQDPWPQMRGRVPRSAMRTLPNKRYSARAPMHCRKAGRTDSTMDSLPESARGDWGQLATQKSDLTDVSVLGGDLDQASAFFAQDAVSSRFPDSAVGSMLRTFSSELSSPRFQPTADLRLYQTCPSSVAALHAIALLQTSAAWGTPVHRYAGVEPTTRLPEGATPLSAGAAEGPTDAASGTEAESAFGDGEVFDIPQMPRPQGLEHLGPHAAHLTRFFQGLELQQGSKSLGAPGDTTHELDVLTEPDESAGGPSSFMNPAGPEAVTGRLKTVEQMLEEQGRNVTYMAEMSGIDLADLTHTHAALLQSFFTNLFTTVLPSECGSSASLEGDPSTRVTPQA